MTSALTSYVPTLKAREAEYGALNELVPYIKDRITPLIEVPDIPFDYALNRPGKTLVEHLSIIPSRLQTCWGIERSLLVELPESVYEKTKEIDIHPVEVFFADLRNRGMKVVPVTRLAFSKYFQEQIELSVRRLNTGIAIRLSPRDFDEDVDVSLQVDNLLKAIGVRIDQVDILIDLQSIDNIDESLLLMSTRNVLTTLPYFHECRSVVLISSSFPENLSDFEAERVGRIKRRDWLLWQSIRKRPERVLQRVPIFGDFAISHPEPQEIDPRVMRMSASIRYTSETEWLIVKGKNVRDYGFAQFNELCRALVRMREYSGETFSWGDNFIARCARDEAGPGNATTWRKVATNHHVTFVVGQLANLSAP